VTGFMSEVSARGPKGDLFDIMGGGTSFGS
jgi:hypothetical protein